jgi:hypothetical protein
MQMPPASVSSQLPAASGAQAAAPTTQMLQAKLVHDALRAAGAAGDPAAAAGAAAPVMAARPKPNPATRKPAERQRSK